MKLITLVFWMRFWLSNFATESMALLCNDSVVGIYYLNSFKNKLNKNNEHEGDLDRSKHVGWELSRMRTFNDAWKHNYFCLRNIEVIFRRFLQFLLKRCTKTFVARFCLIGSALLSMLIFQNSLFMSISSSKTINKKLEVRWIITYWSFGYVKNFKMQLLFLSVLI